MRFRYFSTLIVCLFAVCGCNSNPEVITKLESFDGSQEQLRRLYAEHQCPLVVVGKGIYLPAPGCLCKKTPADAEAAPAPESPPPPTAEEPTADQSTQNAPPRDDERRIA